MKKSQLLPVLFANAVLMINPAFAATVAEKFKDVPKGHWAEKGIEELVIKHSYMLGFEDATFRGDSAFTRIQFAAVMDAVVREIEILSQTSLETRGPAMATYKDLTSTYERSLATRLANSYRLFDGVPGIQNETFRGHHAINRAEVTQVINNLIRLAEQKGVLQSKQGQGRSLSDVVMGESTIPKDEALNRYQFTMTARRAIPTICQLVKENADQRKRNQVAWASQPDLELQMRGGSTSGQGVVVPALSLRWEGSGFVSDSRIQMQSGTATEIAANKGSQNGIALDERVGYLFSGLQMSSFNIQPILGLQLFADFGDNSAAFTGPTYGLRGSSQIAPRWRIVCDLQGSNLLLGQSLGGVSKLTSPEGQFLGRCDLDAQYAISKDISMVFGVGYWEVPVGLRGYDFLGKANVMEVKCGAAYTF